MPACKRGGEPVATQTHQPHRTRFPLGRAERSISPRMNMHFDQGNLVVEASLPGLELGDLCLHLTRPRLNLHGDFPANSSAQPDPFFRNGNHCSSFQSSVDLPAEVDPTRMTTHLRNGVLQIVVPVRRRFELPPEPPSEPLDQTLL